MITLLLITPIIGCLLLILIDEGSKNSQIKMKNVAVVTSLVNFFFSIYLWTQFNSNTTQYQFVYEFNQLSFCHFNMGIDGLSLYFILLTTFITPIALLSNYTNIKNNIKYLLISFLLLETLQILAFVVLDLLLFYIYFESAKWIGISLLCLQLSNSGDILKLIIPNYFWKFISGWTNHSDMVTSYKMSENEMDNRGSKSEIFKLNNITVKEQRVDGSWCIRQKFSPLHLRCTLMGFERSYQIKILSNEFNKNKIFYFSSTF